MLPKHLTIGARLLLAAALVTISFFATTSRSFPVVEHLNDKLKHIMAFTVLGLLTDYAWPSSGFRSAKVVSLMGYGLAIELVQSFLPYRSCSMLDLAADGGGLLIYAVIAPLLQRIYPLSLRNSPHGGPQSRIPR